MENNKSLYGMKKQFHYFYADAMEAAKAFAKENNAYIGNDVAADDRSLQGCEYMDDKADGLDWSGEVSAIMVEDEDGKPIGIFAYWCVDED